MSVVGGCSFDDGPAQCDYQQDPYDDFDWTHVSAQEVPYLPSDLPQGESHTPDPITGLIAGESEESRTQSEIREWKHGVLSGLV